MSMNYLYLSAEEQQVLIYLGIKKIMHQKKEHLRLILLI